MSEGYSVGSGLSSAAGYPRTLNTRPIDVIDEVEVAPRQVGGWFWLPVGLVAGIAGLLPWLLTGMTVPPQNLWATDASHADLPAALLPLSQYRLGSVVVLFMTGGAIAGLIARSAQRRWSASGFWSLAFGVVLVQLFAIVQSSVVVGMGLRMGMASFAYLASAVLVGILAAVGGFVVFALIASAPRGGALLGVAIAAVPAAAWVAAFPAFLSGARSNDVVVLIDVWGPAVIVGVAIAVCGLGSFGRVIAALLALAIVWALPAVNAGVHAIVAPHALAQTRTELVSHGIRVFRENILLFDTSLLPLAAGAVIAILGLVLHAVIGRARRRRDYTYDDYEQYDEPYKPPYATD